MFKNSKARGRIIGLLSAGAFAAYAFTFGSAQAAPLPEIATFTQVGTATSLTWENNIVPAVTKLIPAVTKTTPAVTKVVPAVTQLIPAVTKIVNGKVVVVTPAHTVVITPAHTVIVTPAQTVVVTPAHTVVVTAAHDGPSGSLFSTSSSNPNVAGAAKVTFSFLNSPLAALGPLDAYLTFDSTSPAVDAAGKVGSSLRQSDLSGDFSFIYAGTKPLQVWDTIYLPGANLLSGVVGDFVLQGAKGGTTSTVSGSTLYGETVAYTSDFLKFWDGDEDFSLGLTHGTPSLSYTAGEALHTFSARSGGEFGTEYAPELTAVPEPASWALAIVGFSALGAALRRRRAALGRPRSTAPARA